MKNRDKIRTKIITASPTGSLSRSCILILWYVYRDQFRTFHICKRTHRQQLFISATPTHLAPTQVPTQLYEMWEIYWRKMKLLHSSNIRFFNWMWWIIYTNISENYGERGEKVFVLDTGEETSRWRQFVHSKPKHCKPRYIHDIFFGIFIVFIKDIDIQDIIELTFCDNSIDIFYTSFVRAYLPGCSSSSWLKSFPGQTGMLYVSWPSCAKTQFNWNKK